MHNDCWENLPSDAVTYGKTTPDGRPIYTFKDQYGNQVTAYQGTDGRWYNPNKYAPDNVQAQQGATSYNPYPNRDGAKATQGQVYYQTTKEATEAAEALGFEKVRNVYTRNGQAIYFNSQTGKYISRDIGDGVNSGSHNGGVWKQVESIQGLNSKVTRDGTFDANLNRIGD